MKRETIFLKLVVFLIGIPILYFYVFGLPWVAKELAHYPTLILYPVIIGFYATAIPFFLALYQAFKLLSYVDKNKAFSELSVKALKNIKYCAITISILFVLVMPLVYFIAELDDAPGILALELVATFASFVIAAFAAVLQKLLKSAIDIKSENDLTI